MGEVLLKVIFCHLVGDYVLQGDFIAKTKGENWYHLFVHCALYCLPFYIVFGCTLQLIIIFLTHIFIDALKAMYKVLSYTTDQALHYMIAITCYCVTH
jgi:hypothetical protein